MPSTIATTPRVVSPRGTGRQGCAVQRRQVGQLLARLAAPLAGTPCTRSSGLAASSLSTAEGGKSRQVGAGRSMAVRSLLYAAHWKHGLLGSRDYQRRGLAAPGRTPASGPCDAQSAPAMGLTLVS